MKLKIGDYEVTISARSQYCKKGSEFDTMALLNLISIWTQEAAIRYGHLNCPAIAKEAKKIGDDIHKELEKRGYYK